MDYATFFAGLQAFAAFLQVWQGERNVGAARKAYKEAKESGLNSGEVREKAKRLERKLSENPVFGRLFENRLGRCEDKFEDALRSENEEQLDAAAREFKRCKCLVLQAIQTSDGLGDDLSAEWERLGCEVVLNTR